MLKEDPQRIVFKLFEKNVYKKEFVLKKLSGTKNQFIQRIYYKILD
jgi:hypothetical protein